MVSEQKNQTDNETQDNIYLYVYLIISALHRENNGEIHLSTRWK
jgi:hypothetical protein